MTDNTQELAPRGCPYIGLVEDRTVMLMEASPAHCCFADPSAIAAPTVEHQTATCLCAGYGECPRYLSAGSSVEGQVAVTAQRNGNGPRGGLALWRPGHRQRIVPERRSPDR